MAIWADHEDDKLKRLYADPTMSCARIAAYFPGKTRNSIIGRIHRMGLPRRGCGTGPKRSPQDIAASKQARQNRANARRMEQRREAGIPAAAPRGLKAELRCVVIDPIGIPLADLEAGMCRWPEGEGPYTFCGHPQFGPSSYCGSHFFLSIGHGTRSEREARWVSKSKLGAWG